MLTINYIEHKSHLLTSSHLPFHKCRSDINSLIRDQAFPPILRLPEHLNSGVQSHIIHNLLQVDEQPLRMDLEHKQEEISLNKHCSRNDLFIASLSFITNI